MDEAGETRRGSPLVVQCLVYLAFGAPVGMYGAAWPDARHLYGQTAGALGALATAYGIGRLTTSASAVALLRRASPRRSTAALCVALAAVDLVIAVTRSFALLVAALAAVGLVSGALDSLGARYQTVVRDLRRAGLVFGAYGVGASLGPALVAVTSWTVGFVAAGAVALVAAAAAARPAVAWPGGLDATEAATERAPAPTGPRGPVVLSLALAGTLVALEVLSGGWLATYFEDHRGASAGAAGLAVSGFWAGVTLGRLALSRVRASGARVLTAGAVGVLVGFAAVPVLPVPLALAWVSGVGAVLAVVFPTVVATTADRVGAPAAARVSGWQLLAGNGTSIVLSAAVGVAVGRWGGGVPLVALVLLAVLAVPLCGRAAALVHPGGEA